MAARFPSNVLVRFIPFSLAAKSSGVGGLAHIGHNIVQLKQTQHLFRITVHAPALPSLWSPHYARSSLCPTERDLRTFPLFLLDLLDPRSWKAIPHSVAPLKRSGTHRKATFFLTTIGQLVSIARQLAREGTISNSYSRRELNQRQSSV
jgi:hypothetical protein